MLIKVNMKVWNNEIAIIFYIGTCKYMKVSFLDVYEDINRFGHEARRLNLRFNCV